MIFWNIEVCQGPQMALLPFCGMYQGTQWTAATAADMANSTTQLV